MTTKQDYRHRPWLPSIRGELFYIEKEDISLRRCLFVERLIFKGKGEFLQIANSYLDKIKFANGEILDGAEGSKIRFTNG